MEEVLCQNFSDESLDKKTAKGFLDVLFTFRSKHIANSPSPGLFREIVNLSKKFINSKSLCLKVMKFLSLDIAYKVCKNK